MSAKSKAQAIPKRIFQFWDEPEPPEQAIWLMKENARSASDFEFPRFDRRYGEKFPR